MNLREIISAYNYNLSAFQTDILLRLYNIVGPDRFNKHYLNHEDELLIYESDINALRNIIINTSDIVSISVISEGGRRFLKIIDNFYGNSEFEIFVQQALDWQ